MEKWSFSPRLVSCLVSVALLWLGAVSASATQFRYVFPANISLALEPAGRSPVGLLQITATIESKVGTLRNLEVFFNASPDLSVVTKGGTMKVLRSGTTRSFTVEVKQTNKKPGEMGSWVKMGVRYLPDYQNVLGIVGNAASYPDEIERDRLVLTARTNNREQHRIVDAVRLFMD